MLQVLAFIFTILKRKVCSNFISIQTLKSKNLQETKKHK